MVVSKGNSIAQRVGQLQGEHSSRNRVAAEDLALISQTSDHVKKDGDVEVFLANDPRTLWNMGTFLLQPKPLLHRVRKIDGTDFSPEEQAAARVIEKLIKRRWDERNLQQYKRGESSLFWHIIGWLTGTGWYAIPFLEGGFVDYWNPLEAYPEYDDEGLVALARVRTLPWAKAARLVKREGWDLTRLPSRGQNSSVKVSQLWEVNPLTDEVEFTVLLGTNEVVHETTLLEIPVMVGGVGGVPASNQTLLSLGGNDLSKLRGFMDAGALRGQSILATNRNVYLNLDRQWSFLQQLLHDTANPKTYERRQGNRAIVQSSEEWFKRGAHFTLGQNEDIGVIPMPGIPPELTQLLFAGRNMVQRGGVSDALFGNINTELNSILVSQISEAAQQVLEPYYLAALYIFTEVDNAWYRGLRQKKSLSEVEREALEVLRQDETEMQATYSVKIPGDLAQRINLAKFASSEWELSPETAFEMLVPEVVDVDREVARVHAARAEASPEFQKVNLVGALRAASRRVERTNSQLAALYNEAANQVQIGGGEPSPNGQTPGLQTNIIPRQLNGSTRT